MPEFTLELESLADTESLGRALAALLQPSDLVRLVGDLGAGKTTLTRAIAVAMGADANLITSPTYVFMNHYETKPGCPDLAHLDCYRMGGADDLDTIGFDTVLASGQAVLIEWPERIDRELPDGCATVRIEHVGETHDSQSRLVTLEFPETWGDRPGMSQIRPLTEGGLTKASLTEKTLEPPPRRDTICPATGARVPADSPTWPFASERLQMADLYKWFSGQHAISRPLDQRDLEEGVD
ncbi:MAG: tRNA threonylcarbamoyladenosine biosynthesis protein TsaE [Phycisphaerales bacterium]|jgi:tRNA threonylcarbamoyladenosine biosynthesis protein TsaE